MTVYSLIGFAAFTTICLATLLLINRRRVVMVRREFDRIVRYLSEGGYEFTNDTTGKPIKLEKSYFFTYLKGCYRVIVKGNHNGLEVDIFVAEFLGNFSQSESSTKLCIYIKGEDLLAADLEISSLNNRVYWKSQGSVPSEVELSSEFKEKYAIRGEKSAINMFVDSSLIAFLSPLRGACLEVTDGAILFYTDLTNFRGGNIAKIYEYLDYLIDLGNARATDHTPAFEHG